MWLFLGLPPDGQLLVEGTPLGSSLGRAQGEVLGEEARLMPCLYGFLRIRTLRKTCNPLAFVQPFQHLVVWGWYDSIQGVVVWWLD